MILRFFISTLSLPNDLKITENGVTGCHCQAMLLGNNVEILGIAETYQKKQKKKKKKGRTSFKTL